MDTVTLCAYGVSGIFKALRACRVPPMATIKSPQIDGDAHGFTYAVLASLWMRRKGAPPWEEIYAAWERRSAPAVQPDPTLYGYFHPDDRFELLSDNRAAFVERERLLTNAQRSVDIATYYIQADETGWNTARQLALCAARGIRVRIIADHAETGTKSFENRRVTELRAFLRREGIDYRLFRNSARPYDANHRKLLIVDGTTLVTGGRNYADHYAGTKWRDIDLILSGPSVAALQPLFEKTFAMEEGGYDNVGEASKLFQPTSPEQITDNAAFIFLLQCIATARRTLDIENAYYINHPVLQRRLAAACARGVRVRIFTNSADSNDLFFSNYRIYSGFPELLKDGVEIYLRSGEARTLHCKYFVADNEWVGFGSSNLNYYSPRFCLEAGLHVRSQELASKLTAWFEGGISEAQPLVDSAAANAILEKQGAGRIYDRLFPDLQ
jgi:cardiolipin synthase A/B